MHYKKLVALLLFIQTVTFAQVKLSTDFKVTNGTPYPMTEVRTKDYFSDGKGHAILVKTLEEKVILQRYDVETMKELTRKEYTDFPPINKIQKVLLVGDRLFYIFTSFNKAAKQEDLYLREINMNEGTFETPKLLFSTAAEVAVSSYGEPGNFAGMWGTGAPVRFEVHTSFDNSKLLIRYRLSPTEKNDKKNYDIIGFYVFDSSMVKLWGGEVRMPYTEEQMDNLAYGVSKEGKAFMLVNKPLVKEFELMSIDSDLKLVINAVDIHEPVTYEQFDMQEAKDGNLACLGYYGHELVQERTPMVSQMSLKTSGILYFTIDQKGGIVSKYDFPFSIDLINQYESKRDKEKNAEKEESGKAGIRDVKPIAFSFNQDGSITMIGEQQYIGKRYSAIGEAKSVWVFGDIIATKISANGELLWMKKLPKTQTGMVRKYKGDMSVRYVKGSDANYILYLDDIKNANLGIEDVPVMREEGKGGFLTAYKIDDATGAIEKHSIFDIENVNGIEAFQFRAPRIFGVTDKVFMLEIHVRGGLDSIIKFELTKEN